MSASPKVDFYVLKESEPRARARFACRLADKAFGRGHTVHLHCDDAEQASALDALLWTFRDRAFVPHGPAGSGEPVTIGCAPPAGTHAEVLINLGAAVPEWYAGFGRIAEVVSEDPSDRQAGRARFRFYRDRGLDPETHELGTER
jgi:DNA polymerase-3 subunit chi